MHAIHRAISWPVIVETRIKPRRACDFPTRFPSFAQLPEETRLLTAAIKLRLPPVYYRSPGQETHLLHRRYCACEMHGSARIKLHLYVIRFNYFGISRGFGAMLGIRGLTTCSLNSVFGSGFL